MFIYILHSSHLKNQHKPNIYAKRSALLLLKYSFINFILTFIKNKLTMSPLNRKVFRHKKSSQVMQTVNPPWMKNHLLHLSRPLFHHDAGFMKSLVSKITLPSTRTSHVYFMLCSSNSSVNKLLV